VGAQLTAIAPGAEGLLALFLIEQLTEAPDVRADAVPDDALDQERDRYRTLLMAHPLPVGPANLFIAELLALQDTLSTPGEDTPAANT
jgi:hypothetical protein